jgi:hypothetical protein
MGGAAVPATQPPSHGLGGMFDDGANAFGGPQKSSALPMPSAPLGAPPMSAMNPEATVMFQVPQELIAQSQQVDRSASFSNPGAPFVDDKRTIMQAAMPDLIAQSAGGADAAEEAHFREVYEKFVAKRRECGEDLSDLTYDRFVTKLQKNRQQILEKHKAKSVRFDVYTKDGKAALRALPVRE